MSSLESDRWVAHVTRDARPIVLFDFDGTIADSLAVVVPVYDEVAVELGLRPLAREDLERLRRMGPREAMRAQGIPVWKLPRLVAAVRQRLHARMPSIAPFAGIDIALHRLVAAERRIGIVTSNARDNVEVFLGRHAMPPFELASYGASLFGKARLLRALIASTGAPASEVVYVGDETRDVVAARAVGARSIAVSWGYAHRDALATHGPSAIVDTPDELVDAILGPR